MTDLLCRAALVAAFGMLIAGTAVAGIPPPPKVDLDEGGHSINIVGMLVGGEAPTHENVLKHITLRDFQGNPVSGSIVGIDFSDCIEGVGPAGVDIELGDTQPFAGMVLNCNNKTVAAVSNAAGVASFVVIGYATNGGLTQISPAISDAGHMTRCAEVRVDGIIMGHLNVGAFDQDGAGGVNPTDAALLLADRKAFLPGPTGTDAYRGRSDYDGDGTINPLDLSLWLGVRTVFVASGSNGTSGVACTP